MNTPIKHIVYLMLENRSFDQLLGWLYDDKPPELNIPHQSPTTYDGLKKNTYFNKDANGNIHYITKGVDNMNVPIHDPHEKYEHVTNQLFETKTNQDCCTTPSMGGFYKDFADFDEHVCQITQSYTPDDLPVINNLAKHFAVSDRYFCSVPTQTNCNRAFAAAGNSLGINDKGKLEAFVNNRDFSKQLFHLSQPLGKQFCQKTMWNVLSENGYDQPSDWMHYYSKGIWLEDLLGFEDYAYTRDLMMQLHDKKFDGHFDEMATFFKKAEAGTLPTFSFLEPKWGLEKELLGHDLGIGGTDYHPPTNLVPGEHFLLKIYNSLTSNTEAWKNTLFIINFDEHGGTSDHVAPEPCAHAPWESDGTPTPECRECGFDFKRFGVRVPLILVSPRVPKSTVFRSGGTIPYDHTSVIATILTMFGIDKSKWALGARTANAPTFHNIFTGTDIRTDIPEIKTNSKSKTLKGIEKTTPPNDIQLRIAHSYLHRLAEREGLDKNAMDDLQLPVLAKSRTIVDLALNLEAAVLAIKKRCRH